MVKTELESQPPAFDWTGGVLMRVKLNRDIRMPRTDHGPCAADGGVQGLRSFHNTEIDIGRDLNLISSRSG